MFGDVEPEDLVDTLETAAKQLQQVAHNEVLKCKSNKIQ